MLAVFHWLATFTAHSQGTIIYDQQSSTNSLSFGAGVLIQQNGPLGQSLTPNLSSVGFVQLILNDGNINDGLGATLLVNLRADSISGTILSSSDPMALPNGFSAFSGPVNFSFSTPAPVTPGTLYYIEPIVQSGGPWAIEFAGEDVYPGGTAIINGQSSLMSDLWFREGIVVPEPSVLVLFGLGAGLALRSLKRFCRRS